MNIGCKLAACCLTGAILAGCAHHQGRPFEADVRRQAGRSSMDVEQPAPPKPAPVAARTPTTQPVAVANPPIIRPATQPVAALGTRPTTPPETRAVTGVPVPVAEQPLSELEPWRTESPDIIALAITSNDIRRQWPVSSAYRPSGDTVAGPVYAPDVVHYKQRNDIVAGVMQPFEFLFDLAVLPIRAVLQPPGTAVVYSPVGPPAKEHVDFGQPNMGPNPTQGPIK